jgi:hypothetical protein
VNLNNLETIISNKSKKYNSFFGIAIIEGIKINAIMLKINRAVLIYTELFFLVFFKTLNKFLMEEFFLNVDFIL